MRRVSIPARPHHPVRLVVRDDLRRRRVTVFLRLLLALPHLVWVTLFGIAALTLAFVVWLAVVFERRAPRSLHGFLVGYTRYTVHLSAYLCLVANPYPSFTAVGGPGSVSCSRCPQSSSRRLSAGPWRSAPRRVSPCSPAWGD
jgi:hypothetical protein